jgi:hypothetical protein
MVDNCDEIWILGALDIFYNQNNMPEMVIPTDIPKKISLEIKKTYHC